MKLRHLFSFLAITGVLALGIPPAHGQTSLPGEPNEPGQEQNDTQSRADELHDTWKGLVGRRSATLTWLDAYESETVTRAAAAKRAAAALDGAAATEQQRRNVMGTYAIESYVRAGDLADVYGADSLPAQRTRVTAEAVEADWLASRVDLRLATGRKETAQQQLAAAEKERGGLHDTLKRVDNQIAETAEQITDEFDLNGADLPPAAWAAYRTAGKNLSDTGCNIRPVVLAGVGRAVSDHGRTRGGTLGVDGWVTAPVGDANPLRLDDAAVQKAMELGWSGDVASVRAAAEALGLVVCEQADSVRSWSSLSQALYGVYGDAVLVERALASAARLSASTDTLGRAPLPSRVPGPWDYDGGGDLEPGDVDGMLWWALSRVGTPYSQCIGRPQDPVCPPGTNRFGSGFFDCSGFVAAAYARIGIQVPLTTYAMEADTDFMDRYLVADRVDYSVMEPGDILLQDGHVVLYLGGLMIIHASTGGLQVEPMTDFVLRGTFAVLRPTLGLGGDN